MSAKKFKEIKDLGWTYCSLTKKGFNGAVQTYKNNEGKEIAVAFGFHDAFVVEDDQGLFEAADLNHGIIKNTAAKMDEIHRIVGAKVLVHEGLGEFTYYDDVLKQYGLDSFEIKESIKNRLYHLASLNVLEEVNLSNL